MADMMAASSSGVDWPSITKIFLAGRPENPDKNDLVDLCTNIVKSEADILQGGQDRQSFIFAFANLAADYIASNVQQVSSSQLEVVTSSCKILLKYLVTSLNAAPQNESVADGHTRTDRTVKSIRALCTAASTLTAADVAALTGTMKAETPEAATPSPEKEPNHAENRYRNYLSASIFEQLTLPLRDGWSVEGETDLAGEIGKLFIKANVESLQGLRAGESIMDLCLSLSSIKKAHAKIDEALAGKSFSLPASVTEATAIRNCLQTMVGDVSLMSTALNLPILEPLTLVKLEKLFNLSMSVLYCAVSQSAAYAVISMGSAISPKCCAVQSLSKEEDLDANAVQLVEEALNLYTHIGNAIKKSTRAGGHMYQNYLLAGAWVLVTGLQTHVTSWTSPVEKATHLREDKGRSPSKTRESTGSARLGLLKFQQAFGVLSVALAERALCLLTELFEDLKMERGGGQTSTVQIEAAPISISGEFSALQRVAKILSAAPLNQLFFYLAIVSYRKACTLKRIHPPEGDNFSQSDSTTYYEDMIMCSDVSSTDEGSDDDSEPILGEWFEETLAPPETSETKSPTDEEAEAKQQQSERGNSVVPEKGEANGFIKLATNIFVFLNGHFLSSKFVYVTRYVKAGLAEQHIIILAAIIRDLDKETARTDVGTISVYFGQALGQLYTEFSGALARFTHNLVTHPSLQPLQASLLGHLGVSPWNTDVPHAWPLQVYPRTLAVLAQVLLLRPQNEKEASVISIWHRLVNTLIENVLNTSQNVVVVEGENEDLNVEHAQVLVYLFHSLNLMQKKSVVLLMAGGVLRCSEVARGPLRDSQLLHLSRLLLLFDYIMKNLYDTPQQLLGQMQFNLFHSTNLFHLNLDKDIENNFSRIYTPWKEIEDYHPKSSGDDFSMRPRFYMLVNMEINNQEPPKLDGLACNFILGTPDKLRYPLLLDALVEILNVTNGANTGKITLLGLCATQYCFTICWRLLQLLPPSIPYVERLSTGECLAPGPLLLHSLIWGARCGHKNFERWIKDCLIKQGCNPTGKLRSVHDAVNNLKYDITNAKYCIIALTPDIKKGVMSKESLPPLWNLYVLHAVIAKVQVSLLDEAETNQADANGATVSGAVYVQDLLPLILRLTQAILHCTRWSLLFSMTEDADQKREHEGLQEVLAIASSKNTLISGLAPEQVSLLPQAVGTVIEQWNNGNSEEISWTPYLNDIIVSESFISKIIESHIATLSAGFPFTINKSLKYLLQCLLKFVCQYAPKIENAETKNKAIDLLVSITLDIRTEFLYDTVSKTLDKMIGDVETEEHQKRVYNHVLENTYKLITNYTNNTNTGINEKILHNFLRFYEKIIEKQSGRQALEAFFTGDRDLVKVLMSVSNQQMSQQYSTRVLHFFNKLFQAAEKNPTDPSLNYLCGSMSKLANVESEKLQTWLKHVIIGPCSMSASDTSTPTAAKSEVAFPLCESGKSEWTQDSNVTPSASDDIKSLVQENSQLLQALTNFIVKQSSNVSEDVAITILKALLPLGSHILSSTLEGSGFTDLMVVMTMLADAGVGRGHVYLFPATAEWLQECKQYLSQKDVVEKLSSENNEKNSIILDATCCMLDYLSDIINGILSQSQVPMQRPLSPPWENESPLDQDLEYGNDEINDEEDSGEESDEDSLCNKLCTFTITQKEFMNQHWYHCHTCRMLDGTGVCSICARVCHKGHDITYSKYGNFFCDCGAKEDGSCQALLKRSPQSLETNPSSVATSTSLGYLEDNLTSSLRRKETSPVYSKTDVFIKRERKKNSNVKQIDGAKEWIMNYLGGSSVPGVLLELLQAVIPAVEAACNKNSPVGCYSRAMKALQQLHGAEKKYLNTDKLMVPTLGSQEGAFENVRMSYAGEQGQTIRQLLSAHIIRRVTMCCMSSPMGKRQHLAVAHEKGKITVLQLSALLKQVDSSSRKLTLNRLATAPIPFTVLSLSSNLCNEDYLAVCGLKDCHVLTFTSSGSVTDHLVLHPQLETGNFILKAVWLPGSQTKLALVTADFVKIYDLAKDALSPQYYFLVPSGKIRDCTFMYESGQYNILLMSSPGHIYTETLNEESSAKHGSFYVTNTLEVFYLDVIDVNGQVAGGGVSIYYSHTLGLLFYSYAQGKSFVSPITPRSNCLTVVYSINLPPASKSNGGKTPAPQPLCQWTEIPNHPGLICCAMQSSNNPVVLMIKPESLSVQEIKVVPPKSKIMDMVAIRHNSVNDQRTTLILLCEDGSLKIYMANMDQTGYWMSPSIQPSLPTTTVAKPRKKKPTKTGKVQSSVSFPVDFFEHSTPMNDVELGGNDLLQIYNVAQLKHRLNTSGLYVVSTKALGFTLEISNSDNNMVMTGIRVLIGTQDPQRAPTYIEVFGRVITTVTTRSRWFDIPFSREESQQADKKLTVTFGPSQDPETVTLLESIKVYGKTKEAFGWPEESEETVGNSTTPPAVATNGNENGDVGTPGNTPLTKLDKFVSGMLDVLDGSFCLYSSDDRMASHKSTSINVATELLTLPTPPSLQMHSTSLLSALHPSTLAYHNYKDHALLQHVLASLTAMTEIDLTKNKHDLDAESYYRLILIVRGIAVSRPQNLVKFADSHTSIQDVTLDDPLEVKTPKSSKNQHLLLQLMDVLWLLHSLNPENPALAPVVVPGLKHTEQVVFALVEIVHAFNSCDTYSNITIAVYLQLLLCDDPVIAFSAKHALSRVLKPKSKRRRVFIPSPPHCSTPPAKTVPGLPIPEEESAGAAVAREMARFNVEAEALAMLRQQQQQQPEGADNHNVNPLEAFLGGGAAFQPLLDIPLDADDETMVELAIALSLQEHELGGEQALQVLSGNRGAGHQGQEAGHFSDTTASAAGSDDEGSTAATDGSTLRTSPAEQGGSAGSESGGSGVESITGEHNVSGRSSAYGDTGAEAVNKTESTQAVTSTSYQEVNQEVEVESENSSRLHVLRLQLLERLIEYLPKLRNVTGVRAIPFFQVVLQLTSDLDGHSERDKACLNSLLASIVVELQIAKPNLENICQRTSQREVQLVIMRLLSVLMTRWKSSSASTKPTAGDNSLFVASTTATVLHKAEFINYCLKLLQALLDYWKETSQEESSPPIGGNLLKDHLHRSPPDMSPFFLRQFVKGDFLGNASDIFHIYPQLLSEMALRLPYQVHKHSEIEEHISSAFETAWFKYLCEYMMFSHIPFIRRLVRKLLLFICGSKDKYRQLRDVHALNAHMKAVRICCLKGGFNPSVQYQHAMSLPYDTLVEMVEHLKACLEIAVSRVGNWQKFCICHNDMLAFLFQVSCILDEGRCHWVVYNMITSQTMKAEGVAPTILQLLNCAIVLQSASSSSSSSKKTDVSKTTSRKEREKSDDSVAEAAFEEASCVALVEQINQNVSRETLARFIRTFILETNNTTLRWQAHSLILSLYNNSKLKQKEDLLELLWQLWPLLPTYGRKAAQFVDLLGFFSLKMSQNPDSSIQISSFVDKAVDVLRAQNQLLSHHPNANLYAHMGQYVELEGYYLESDPCLVCNNPEVPLSTIKLSSIKVDSKFTTTTQIVKLLSSHTISKITIRIGDLKRTKMVRTVNIYYNNRNVQAVVELKNKPALWHKAKKVNLQSGQTEIKIEFPLPIVACNLMIEYADFFENIQASSETLQCPRCSAAVPANPGVCSNCGENVFQCHKCRAINYDEKDPFLCHACGFCKYAKFDFTLQAKPCCAVEPIETDEDRKKMVSSINALLEKADRVYKQLMGNKPSLEQLVLKVTEQRTDRRHDEPQAPTAATVVGGTMPAASQVKVNKTIQMIAQQYCNECKTSFEELSKIIQKVLVSRKELVAYDRRHRDPEVCPSMTSSQISELQHTTGCAISRCYGCSTAATEHCLTLLRALAINTTLRQVLCSKGLIQELLANNLRKGSVQIQEEVRQLLCILSKENSVATEELCELITERVTLGLSGQTGDLGIRHEIALLASLQQIQDDCWETRLRCLVDIFLKACDDTKSPLVIEAIILPCLQIWHGICKPKVETTTTSKKTKINNNAAAPKSEYETSPIDVYSWVRKDSDISYKAWSAKQPIKREGLLALPTDKEELRKLYLAEKYANRWKLKTIHPPIPNTLELHYTSWVKTVLFNPSSRLARQITGYILEQFCTNYASKKQILTLLTSYLTELSTAGESASEYLALYQSLMQDAPWKQYLTLNHVLITIAHLITQEIEQLHRLEETTLTSDLTQGYALNHLTELLASFLEDPAIRRQHKGRLVGAVLNGYLSLRRLVVQRTRLVDDTQEKLLELLEEMTSGTEQETRAFMCVCMETVERYSLQDVLTPVFIFERLCSIIYPEENDIGEFFLTLEKDPQQEDFLQGRMLGNPYSSIEAGLGPLMRDVKNKICQDCELVALLEDDNGMELLVNNKIMSLDLPVKDVYKKVWLAEGGEVDSMRVVYRMRGLLGDATEEFVESLSNKSQAAVDNEEVYKMANVLAECGGLNTMVVRLEAIQNVRRAKTLLQVLLKLFRLSVKVFKVQEVLTYPELGAMGVFLRTLQLCLEGEPDATQAAVTEQLLDIMETVLARATSKSLESFMKFSQTFGGPEYVQSLLTCTNHTSVRNNQSVLIHLTRVLAALVYGDVGKMKILLDHFRPVLDFNAYDAEHTPEDQQKLEMFCVLTDGIERNAIGDTLKNHIIELNIVKDALDYITMHAPCVKPTLLRTDSDELKEFISKPALKYILRFLTGMAHSHENTQFALSSADTIPIIHRLEQVSSDEHVGSLAENLLEALRTNPTVATRIEEVREFTRSEKKRLAMAMREKQLGQLGMRTNDKGQVTAKSTILQQMEELGEETGLVCCICREGYKYQPTKVLAIYTFTKRCNVEDSESKPRKTLGYNTVTHFNIVHVDCHMSAVRLARARDEWESAALQNANTKCNGLLPLWGPQVPESAFASCLARHNTYLQESTNHRDIGHSSTVHDLKLLLLRFALEKAFHEDTGGGGPQSNMHMVPYLIHMALYVINTTRVSKKEETNLSSYLDQAAGEKWIDTAYESEGPLYWLTMSILLHSPQKWSTNRITHLRRLIVTGHVRNTNPGGGIKTLSDKSVKDYAVYKPYLVFFGLVDGVYNNFFKNVSGTDDQWSSNLADYIRHNDEALLKGSEKLLGIYIDELLPCASFSEFCDVVGLLDVIADPESYIESVLNGI